MSTVAQPATARRRPDYSILVLTLVLTVVGLLAVYSASFAIGYSDYSTVNYFITKQAVAAVVGLVLLLVCARIDLTLLRRYSPLIMAISLASLLIVLVPHVGV